MKTFFCSLFLSLFSIVGYAQTEPEFEMEPYVFNNADSTLVEPLACEDAYEKAKAGASVFLTGIGKVKSYYYINGLTSKVKINKNESSIIINTGGTSPLQTLSIIKLEKLDSKRRWQTGEVGSFTGASTKEDNAVELKYKKYGKNSVILSIAHLSGGEYCLVVTNMMTNSKSRKVYTFRIKRPME